MPNPKENISIFLGNEVHLLMEVAPPPPFPRPLLLTNSNHLNFIKMHNIAQDIIKADPS